MNQEMSNPYLEGRLPKKELWEQMVIDLELLLAPYKNKDIGLRILSNKTQISEKTLKRMLKAESTPHGLTLQRFYEYFFKLISNEENYKPIHKKIKEVLEKVSIYKKHKIDGELEKELQENKVFRDLFLFTRTGPVYKEWVLEQYGLFGLEVVGKMIQHDLLIEREKNVYVEGALSISKSSETLKKIILDLIKDHLHTEKLQEYGHNIAFYAMEGVNDQSLEEILSLTEDYKRKVAAVVLRPENKGSNRVFALSVVDLMNIDEGNKGKLH